MRIGTAQTMRNIDRFCIEELKLPSIVLMENAASKVVKNIDISKQSSFVIVCGKGNNGGDGFAVARQLFVLGKKAEVFLVGSKDGMTEDCKRNYEILKNLGIKINKINNVEDANELREALEGSDAVIDAVFGTGLSKPAEDIYDLVISIVNENSSYIISIDVPSGFDSDKGKALGNCIRANKTISFQLYKRGFFNYGSDKYTGEIIIEDIGVPDSVINKFHENEFLVDKSMIKNRLIVRDKYAYKGDYGKVLIFAGSKGYTGAAYISVQGAVRSGSGLVTLCCKEDIQSVLSSKLTEAMTVSTKENERVKELIEKSNAAAIGPGMGDNGDTLRAVIKVIKEAKCPIVIDADGINVIRHDLTVLKERRSEIILTPHIGEMARLLNLPIDYIRENRLEVAKQFAKEYNVILLLKGYNSIITDGNKLLINSTGNSSMASGGMGDCLTGMIASFIGQGYEPMEAACIATFVHGYCGERLSRKMFCVNAEHLLEEIPFAIKDIQEGQDNKL